MDAPAATACMPCLPSGSSAYKVMRGDLSSLPEAGLHMLGRSALIGLGLYIGGVRGRDLARLSLLGGGAIEVFVIVWATWQARRVDAH